MNFNEFPFFNSLTDCAAFHPSTVIMVWQFRPAWRSAFDWVNSIFRIQNGKMSVITQRNSSKECSTLIHRNDWPSIKSWKMFGLLYVSHGSHTPLAFGVSISITICSSFAAIHRCSTNTVAYGSRVARRRRNLARSSRGNDKIAGNDACRLWSGKFNF